MKIYELLSQPHKWTRNALARDVYGDHVNSCSEDAVCWCLAGAILKCYPEGDGIKIAELIESAINLKYDCGGIMFNDEIATYEDVYNLVKELDV